jgi:transcription elongation factor Elf1
MTRRPPHERPTAAELALTVLPNMTRCPKCGGRRWVVSTQGEVQYRKCSSCGDTSKTLRIAPPQNSNAHD